MPLPGRRIILDDEFAPRHLAGRRPPLKETLSSSNFIPARPSPLTTRPFSGAYDEEDELTPHVPVPLDPSFGSIAAPLPERRRTPRLIQTFSEGYLEHAHMPLVTHPPTVPTAQEASSLPEATSSTASSESSGNHLHSRESRPQNAEQSLSARRALYRPSSFADMREKVSMFATGSSSSLGEHHNLQSRSGHLEFEKHAHRRAMSEAPGAGVDGGEARERPHRGLSRPASILDLKRKLPPFYMLGSSRSSLRLAKESQNFLEDQPSNEPSNGHLQEEPQRRGRFAECAYLLV